MTEEGRLFMCPLEQNFSAITDDEVARLLSEALLKYLETKKTEEMIENTQVLKEMIK